MTTENWITLIVAILAAIVGLINGVLYYRANKKKPELSNNPHPCKEHSDKIEKLDERLDEIEKEQVRQGQKVSDICRILDRVENKLNGMK